MLVRSIIALAFAVSPQMAKAEAVSAKTFRDQLAETMLALKPGMCVKAVDDYTMHFGASAKDCESFVNIDNAYAEYQANPSEHDAIIKRYAESAVSLLSPKVQPERKPEQVVALLRPKTYTSQIPNDDSVSMSFAGDLNVYLMLDYVGARSLVTKKDLEKWKLSPGAAFDLARRNTRERLGQTATDIQEGIAMVSADSGLATGSLWLPDACKPDGPQRLILVADKEYYFSAEQTDIKAVAALKNVARGMIADGVSLSQTLLACSHGRWIEEPL